VYPTINSLLIPAGSLLWAFLYLSLPLLQGQAICEFTAPAFSPDGRTILFAANPHGQYDLYNMDLQSREVRQLTDHPAHDWYGEWSTDGTIYFQSDRQEQRALYHLDPASGAVEEVISGNVNQVLHYGGADGIFYYVSYKTHAAPDGRQYPDRNTFEIMRWDAGKKISTALTKNDYMDDAPHLSPDGKTLAFQSGKDGQVNIFLMNTGGRQRVQLTDRREFDGIPVWSPDGKRIAFTRKTDDNYDVWVMQADGSSPLNLSHDPAMDLYAAWTPDGSRIAFSSWRDGSQQIYWMDATSGAEPFCLTCGLVLP
jgi:TolB protein